MRASTANGSKRGNLSFSGLASKSGFTLVEVMVSMTLLISMMLVITEVISQAQRSWKGASSRISQFRQARMAFDMMVKSIRQADIQPTFGYAFGPDGANRVPKQTAKTTEFVEYENPGGPVIKRYADLRFVTKDASTMFQALGNSSNFSGDGIVFEAPLGHSNDPAYRPLYDALCARGYFVLFGDDRQSLPTGLASRLNPRFRFRLYELRQATEENRAYGNTLGAASAEFLNFNPTSDKIQPIADNIVGIVFVPIFGSTASATGVVPAAAYALDRTLNQNQAVFTFDSQTEPDPARNGKLPRALRCIAFAIDEESAERLTGDSGNGVPQELRSLVTGFSAISNLDKDINDLQQKMDQQRINFRAFTATIPILAGQW